jgi:hypothetical protein
MTDDQQFHLPSLVQESKPHETKTTQPNSTPNPVVQKGVFHEHRILIVFCAIVILVAIVIVLVYYFSKRDLPKKQAEIRTERKIEEKNMSVDNAEEREKIRRINARRQAARVERDTGASEPKQAPVSNANTPEPAPPKNGGKNLYTIDDIVGQSQSPVENDQQNKPGVPSASSDTQIQKPSAASLEEHQQQNIVGSAAKATSDVSHASEGQAK